MDVKELFEASAVEKDTDITQIEIKKAEEVFGKEVKSPGRIIAVVYTSYGREAHAIPHGIEYKDNKWEVIDEIKAVKSVRNPNSWFGRFYKQYGKFPEENMEVKLTVNARGFTVIMV